MLYFIVDTVLTYYYNNNLAVAFWQMGGTRFRISQLSLNEDEIALTSL